MITVRFPNGLAVQYNGANFAERRDHWTDIRTEQGGRLIAQVPTAGCIVEFVTPCRVYDALRENEQSQIAKDLRAIKRRLPPVRKRARK